jgi:Co/Zn/Cd efflux system component
MSAGCHSHDHGAKGGAPLAKTALWIALIINLIMFVVEIAGGALADSVGLLADAVDFFGDSVNYALSLAVLGFAAIWHTRVAFLKGLAMFGFGCWVWLTIVLHWLAGTVPVAPVMGGIAFVAMLANIVTALVLFRFRGQDANMASVWICSRNDALSNIAVMLAATGVWATASGIPDLIVGALIGSLAIFGGIQVLRMVQVERRDHAAARVGHATATDPSHAD